MSEKKQCQCYTAVQIGTCDEDCDRVSEKKPSIFEPINLDSDFNEAIKKTQSMVGKEQPNTPRFKPMSEKKQTAAIKIMNWSNKKINYL